MKSDRVKMLALSSVMAALTFVMMLISVPLPGGGYANLGDAAVLISGAALGALCGGISAGVGAAIADVVLGFPIYAPGTFLIKAMVAMTAAFTVKIAKRATGIRKTLITVMMFALGEVIMAVGYFIYEFVILGYGAGAVSGLIGNIAQGAVCLILGVFLYAALGKIKINNKTIV